MSQNSGTSPAASNFTDSDAAEAASATTTTKPIEPGPETSAEVMAELLLAENQRMPPDQRRAYGAALAAVAEFVGPLIGVDGREWWTTLAAVAARGRDFTAEVIRRYAAAIVTQLPLATGLMRLAAVVWGIGVLNDAGMIPVTSTECGSERTS